MKFAFSVMKKNTFFIVFFFPESCIIFPLVLNLMIGSPTLYGISNCLEEGRQPWPWSKSRLFSKARVIHFCHESTAPIQASTLCDLDCNKNPLDGTWRSIGSDMKSSLWNLTNSVRLAQEETKWTQICQCLFINWRLFIKSTSTHLGK